MATYSSYKQITTEMITDSIIATDNIAQGSRLKPTTFYVFHPRGLCCQNCSNAGGCIDQAYGYCCLWTVPACVTRVVFEMWSGGGGGAGHTCCNCCSFSLGGSGGNYAIKSITTAPGCQYTICAGGSWPCAVSHTCVAANGCTSWIQGYNLSNFCVLGGCAGVMCNGDAWGLYHHATCANNNICSQFGADFGVPGTTGFKMGHAGCHCSGADGSWTGNAPFIGKVMGISATESWCSCGCYVNWPAGGGMSGQSSYCNNHAKMCAAGMGMGGSGIVKVTYA